MDDRFIAHLFARQKDTEQVPPNSVIAQWANSLICLLFPEKSECCYNSVEEIKAIFINLENELTEIMHGTKACECCDIKEISAKFFNQLPDILWVLQTDIQAILNGDPAAHSHFEIVRAYPGFLAICYYRLSHALYLLDVPFIPRILTEHAHGLTGIDIHPGAKIGEHFFIDHGTGIVIGETCEIGKHVKLYQGVTLGALSVEKSMARQKRHPTVGDNVVIYSNATILGGETVIGSKSTIGGNVWLTRSIPTGTKVYHKGEVVVIEPNLIEN